MAAGLGFKDFTTGEVLTAADVDGYLMQGVWVFADAAARTAAVTSPQEGNISFLKDTNSTEYYSGSAWVAIGGSVPASYGLSAGKNTIINGGFDVWQRGTASTAIGSGTFLADRWQAVRAGFASGASQSRQVTGDTTNLPNIQYCARVQRDSGNTSTAEIYLGQNFETINSIPLAGKTVVFSFYARRGANYSAASNALRLRVASGTGTDQNFITGSFTGSTDLYNATAATLTTTWARYSVSFTVGATATQIGFYFNHIPVGTAGANDYFEVTGAQLELGTTATDFAENGTTAASELAACQRYYTRLTSTDIYSYYVAGSAISTSTADFAMNLPTTLRTIPSSIDYSNIGIGDGVNAVLTGTFSIPSVLNNKDTPVVRYNGGGSVVYRPYFILNNNGTGFIGFNAEL